MEDKEKLLKIIEAMDTCHTLKSSSHFAKFSMKIVRTSYPYLLKLRPLYQFLKQLKNTLEEIKRRFYASKNLDPQQLNKSNSRSEIVWSKNNMPKIAVVIHLYYIDLSHEILDFLKNIPFDYTLFINSPNGDISRIEDIFSTLNQELFIDSFPNKGRDILPFLKSLAKYQINTYDLVCKIHTKKSLHTDFGNNWRFAQYNSLLGTRKRVSEIFDLLSPHSDIGIVGCKELLFDFPINPQNSKNLNFLNRHYKFNKYYCSFFAGTMFWAKGSIFQKLLDYPLNEELFSIENGDVDGNLEHAFERIFGTLCKDKNLKIAALPINTFEKESL
jgi:lipopolysaccharide biosynthesis protein